MLSEISEIRAIMEDAVRNQYLVEFRVEDVPEMKMDFTAQTKLKKVNIIEDNKTLYVEGERLHFMFQFTETEMGTWSAGHDKFYFRTDKVSLTVVVFRK